MLDSWHVQPAFARTVLPRSRAPVAFANRRTKKGPLLRRQGSAFMFVRLVLYNHSKYHSSLEDSQDIG